jgi:hypothetical protein
LATLRWAFIRPQRYRQADLLCSTGEEIAIGQAYELAGKLALGDRNAQFRTDAGRFTRGQCDADGHPLPCTPL